MLLNTILNNSIIKEISHLLGCFATWSFIHNRDCVRFMLTFEKVTLLSIVSNYASYIL